MREKRKREEKGEGEKRERDEERGLDSSFRKEIFRHNGRAEEGRGVGGRGKGEKEIEIESMPIYILRYSLQGICSEGEDIARVGRCT